MKMEQRIEHIFEDVRENAREFDKGQRSNKRMAQDIKEVIANLVNIMLDMVQ